MNIDHLKYLFCPSCSNKLSLLKGDVTNQKVESGILECTSCSKQYPIIRYIPRFVIDDKDNYSSNFGFQWNKHYKTQYDSYCGIPISRDRFVNETRWGDNLTNELMLEAGSGSGRFTEHAVSTGAMVISFDYSNAVDANYKNNGQLENLETSPCR